MDLLRRPEVEFNGLMDCLALDVDQSVSVCEQVEIQTKYEGYLVRQQQEIERQKHHEHSVIPATFNYHQVIGLSHEVKQKLIEVQPQSLAQAARIPGVTPAAIALLLVYLKKITV